jgi:hypothetical protein
MKWLLEVGIFAASAIAGSILGGLVPKGVVRESWRIRIAALLIAAGIALAVIASSRLIIAGD